MLGEIVDVTPAQPIATSVTVDAAVGDRVLAVADALWLDGTGRLSLDGTGQVVEYVGRDDEEDTVTLAAGLPVALPVESSLTLVDASGRPREMATLWVSDGSPGSRANPVRITDKHVGQYRGDPGQYIGNKVLVAWSPRGWVLEEAPDTVVPVDGGVLLDRSVQGGAVDYGALGQETIDTGLGVNLLTNPDYEDAALRAKAEESWLSTASVFVEGAAARSGSWLLEHTLAGEYAPCHGSVAVQPGERYYLSGYAKALSGAGSGGIVYQVHDAAGTRLVNRYVASSATTSAAAGWLRQEGVFVIPAGGAVLSVWAYATDASVWQVDGFSLIRTVAPDMAGRGIVTDPLRITGYGPDGTQMFLLDSTTGQLALVGSLVSGPAGTSRVEVLPDAFTGGSPGIRFTDPALANPSGITVTEGYGELWLRTGWNETDTDRTEVRLSKSTVGIYVLDANSGQWKNFLLAGPHETFSSRRLNVPASFRRGTVGTGPFTSTAEVKSIPVTYPSPGFGLSGFASIPDIHLTPHSAAPGDVHATIDPNSITESGFTIRARRTSGTGGFTISWTAFEV